MTEASGLCVNQVSHSYGKNEAVKNASLEVAPGQVHCLLGASGSGKSTLLRIVAGLESPQNGSVTIAGERVSGAGLHQSTEERSVGLVFQDYALFPHLSVLKNVTFGMSATPKRERRDRAIELLSRVEMQDSALALPHTLSGGQQQRVALARALAREPAVMLLDEPFSGLDPRLRAHVREITLRVLRESGAATLMVTHDPQEALAAGDKISIIREGQLIQTAPPKAIYHTPVDETSATVFGPINTLPYQFQNGHAVFPFGQVPLDLINQEYDLMANQDQPTVFVRPERLQIIPANTDEASNAETPVGVIQRLQTEGPTELATITFPSGDTVLVRTLAPTNHQIGQPAIIRWRGIPIVTT